MDPFQPFLKYRKTLVMLLLHAFFTGLAPANDKSLFQSQIAPLLADKCLSCHSGTTRKGNLDLSSAKNALEGGENGPAINLSAPADSLIWQRVADDEMPPKKHLNLDEKKLLKEWVKSGMHWPEGVIDPFQFSTDRRAGYDWWAFQPVAQSFPEIPKGINPVDFFLDAKLTESKLIANGEAKPRDILRRLYFDMIGLPPDPKVLQDYIESPVYTNYQAIVDRLLASPQFGERWARHWLDVVRYGESTGFERNAPNFTIWRYRDWIIKSFNEDLPFNQFAQMQVAGDLIKPGPEGAAAASFMVAGVHNTVIGVSQRMRLLARQDELEENIGVLGQTFLGLTVQCARCHDHKFDPISNSEYYGFISAIDGVQHGELSFPVESAAQRLKSIDAEMQSLRIRIAAIEDQARSASKYTRHDVSESQIKELPKPFAMWTFDLDARDEIGGIQTTLEGGAKIENGALLLDGRSAYLRTATLKKNFGPKTFEAWVQTDNLDQRGGGVVSLESSDGSIFDAIVFGEQEPRKWMAGSDGFSRTSSFQAQPEEQANQRPVHIAIVYEKDGTVRCYRDSLPYGLPIQTNPVKYPLNDVHIAIGIRHLPAGANKHFEGRVLRAAVYDRPLSADEIASSAGRESGFLSENDYQAVLSKSDFDTRKRLKSQFSALQKEHAETIKNSTMKIYTIAPRQNPGPMRVHMRGDVTEFGQIIPPNGLKAVGADSAWDMLPESTDNQRRLKLAEWLSSKENPLFARVIVNRVWHYHFGTGIVETPNDFGFNGGRPSHPDLLDYLARYLMDHGMKLKSLHRLIVTSKAYRRSSARNTVNFKTDAGNRMLWRFSPARLEGEVLRDSMLAISGLMNPQMGGPGFIDVTVDENNGTTYYEPLDPTGHEFQRRTIYRFSPRGGRSTLLDTFDCPDPSSTSPRRNVTTTPLQALSLLHGSFAVRASETVATDIENKNKNQNTGHTPEILVRSAWQRILQRQPEPAELHESIQLAQKHGLWAVCLALFNTNEFVIVP